jgi:hypothetical protein
MGSTPPAEADVASDLVSAWAEGLVARGFLAGRALGWLAGRGAAAAGCWVCGAPSVVADEGLPSDGVNTEESVSGLILSDSARSDMLMFMPRKVASVIFCTSRAWMVALTALVFWSSQKCTVFNSWMRLSSSSGSSVGAIHVEAEGNPAGEPVLESFLRKSKPGTNFEKSNEEASDMAGLRRR